MKIFMLAIAATLIIAQAEAVIRVNPNGTYVVDNSGVCVDIGVE